MLTNKFFSKSFDSGYWYILKQDVYVLCRYLFIVLRHTHHVHKFSDREDSSGISWINHLTYRLPHQSVCMIRYEVRRTIHDTCTTLLCTLHVPVRLCFETMFYLMIHKDFPTSYRLTIIFKFQTFYEFVNGIVCTKLIHQYLNHFIFIRIPVVVLFRIRFWHLSQALIWFIDPFELWYTITTI